MKKISLFLYTIIYSLNVFAQGPSFLWAKGMGGTSSDISQSVAVDASGNVYTAGGFNGTVDFDPGAGVYNLTSVGSNDIFICKLDASGNFVWAKAMGGTGFDFSNDIKIDDSGNIFTTGSFSYTTDFDPGTGVYNLTSAGNDDIFISKLDASGNFVWAKALGGTNTDEGQCMVVDASGNVFTTGTFSGTADFDPGLGTFNLTSAGFWDAFISKFDGSGNFVWAKAIRGTSDDISYSIALDIAGNIYTTGLFGDTADFDPGVGVYNLTSAGNDDIFISKLDSSGNFVWAKIMGESGTEQSFSIALDVYGNVYTTGSFENTIDIDPGPGIFNLTSAGNFDIFIAKLDSSGNLLWAKSMGGIGADHAFDIALDSSGSVYTVGRFQNTADFDPGVGVYNITSAGGIDIFISKLDSSGNFVWAKVAGGTGSDSAASATITSSNKVLVTGSFSSPTITFDLTTLVNVGSGDIYVASLDISTSFQVAGNEDGFRVSPNPATSELRIQNAEFRIEKVEMYNMVGEVVLDLTLNPSPEGEGLRVDVSSLREGIYFVTLTDENGNKVVRKFVKM
jgi:hypothetical protein